MSAPEQQERDLIARIRKRWVDGQNAHGLGVTDFEDCARFFLHAIVEELGLDDVMNELDRRRTAAPAETLPVAEEPDEWEAFQAGVSAGRRRQWNGMIPQAFAKWRESGRDSRVFGGFEDYRTPPAATPAEMDELVKEWERRAERDRKRTRAYDGGGWDMVAQTYDTCADDLRAILERRTK